MRTPVVGWLATMLLSVAAMGWAQDRAAKAPETTGPEPQIVRVSYVEGDVRISRGKDAEKQTHADWERATADLPIEEGFSLVTGTGRAEIEFEDASVGYLAENSVLVFNQLYTLNGIPRTELALLSGALSISATPMVAGEWYTVRTPTDSFTLQYPDHSFLRVNSYLDGATVTSVGSAVFHADHPSASPTRAAAYRNGKRIPLDQIANQTSYAEFDHWVLHRAVARSEAMSATMKEAGLKEPISGLAQLQGQGRFYACPPYGTCWEPTNGFAGQVTDADKAAMAQQTVSVKTLAKGGPNSVPNAPNNLLNQTSLYEFPCSPFGYGSYYGIDPMTGLRLPFNGLYRTAGYGYGAGLPYLWAVCHTGSWIQNQGHYAWVSGTMRHHECPVHWVKVGRGVGFVPIHPKDVAGKPPVNLKDGLVLAGDKHGSKFEVVSYNPGTQVKVLAQAPKEFLKENYSPLAKSDAPHLEAHLMRPTGPEARASGTPITFDHKTQSFMVAHQGGSGATSGGSNRMMEPIGGRGGDLQAHSGGSSSSGAVGSRGGSSGSYGGGGNSGAAASRSGGGSSAPAPSAPSAASAPSGGGSSAAASSSGGKR